MVSFVLCPRTNENEADCPCCMQHNKVERQYMKDMNTLAKIIEAKDAEIQAMRAVVEAANALAGDLIAADEEPTHYVSWFQMTEALDALKK